MVPKTVVRQPELSPGGAFFYYTADGLLGSEFSVPIKVSSQRLTSGFMPHMSHFNAAVALLSVVLFPS